jgi:predicted membrane-bound dolichyl-phosphate-mannose-protein mannosyltransferase
MGSIAILGMYALVRAAGGGPWTAVGAATLMAADPLLLVMGRIGTLDIYAVAAMVWGVALYVRSRPFAAGVVLAVATAFKEVSPYALFVLVLLELGRLLVARREPGAPADWTPRDALKRLAAAVFTTCGVFVGLLAIMGEIATPYADSQAKLITGGPFAEIWHIITYARGLTSPHGPTGIASYPWQWLIDLKPILYLRINPSLPGHGLYAIHPVVAFWGIISPAILLVGMPALVFCAYRLVRPLSHLREDRTAPDDRQLPILALAWFIGTWLPFALQALIDQRTSYLYYMVIVMPGIYAAAAYLVALGWRRRSRWLSVLTIIWGLGVIVSAVLLYPFVAVF